MGTRSLLRVFQCVVALLSLAALVGVAGAGCETQTEDGGDGGTLFCKTDKDCPSGANCSFPIDVGCTALGECRYLANDADPTQCSSPGGAACACNGTTITVPSCWNFLAPMAVQYMGPCSDGGPVDAPID